MDGEVNNKAWLYPPKTNRLLLFQGNRLHGVIPHVYIPNITTDRQSSLTSSKLLSGKDLINYKNYPPPSSRITLMIGWWGKDVSTTPTPSPNTINYTPNMIMPSIQTNTNHWSSSFGSISSELLSQTNLPLNSSNVLIPVEGDVWESIPSPLPPPPTTTISSSSTSSNSDLDSDSTIVFVGNWFLKERSEILDEIFPMKSYHDNDNDSESFNANQNKNCLENVEWISIADLKKLRGE